MSAHRIAKRYAKSLLDLAKEQNLVNDVLGDLKGFRKAVASNRDFLLMLKSPIIHSDKKSTILKEIFSGKVNDLTMRFFDIVVKKKREMFLPEIADAFQEKYNEENQIASATLTTAVPATESILQEVNQIIKEHTNAQQVELTTHIDENMIGGFVLKFQDKLYDARITTQLARLKKEFSKN